MTSVAPPAPAKAAPSALDGVLVLDLSRVLAGPWATQILADLGATVIKVERPGAGDDTRAWGPPFTASGDAAYFLAANRNKRSVTIDFTKPAGGALVQALARKAAIVVENFKTGGLAKYHLDYHSISALNPALVYCSVTGFGQTGPYSGRAGYDYLVQAMGGLMSITGQPDHAAGAEPMKVGVAVADLFTGMYAVTGILAALRHAERTGQGQHLDVALLDCQAAMLANQAMNFLVSGQAPGRLGNAHPNIVPYQVFATLDGHLVLAVGNDGQFKAFCAAAGVPELAQDLRFARNADRVAHRAALLDAIAPVLAGRSTPDWIAALETAGVPCGPINTIDQVFADPQVQARGLVQTMTRANGEAVQLVASPLHLSQTPPCAHSAPPLLGEHTRETLGALLGLDATALDGLKAGGVI
jgi:crotonobetainyl-CoA:carnitine CoA-transferase CaiB-like acyl-CoA transferase